MKAINVIVLIFLISSTLCAQYFSQTYNTVPIAFERGRGLAVSSNSNIYCTSTAVCQDLSVACTNVYKFNLDGDLVWNRLLSNNWSANWENISKENDTIYIAGQDVMVDGKRYLDEILLSSDTGDSIGYDNFNAIYQVMEGPEEELYFLCSSTSHTTDHDDYRLVKYDPDTQETEVIKHFPFQSTHSNFPFYTILSDQFVMTNRIYDYEGILPPLISMVGLSFEGDSLWQFKVDVGDPFEDLRTYDIYEMTSCANDDILICGEFENGDSNDAGFIMRISPEGELLWERSYWSYDNNGGLRDSYLSALREMPDGSIVAIGSMQQESVIGAEEDFWILKVGANGCYRDEDDCDDVSVNQWLTSIDDVLNETILVLYPNPVRDILTIESEEIIEATVIYSMDGRILSSLQQHNTNIRLDVSNLKDGIYYLSVITSAGTSVKSFVKH